MPKDTLCSRLWKVEMMEGGLARFILTVDTTDEYGRPSQQVAARIVLPIDSVPDAIMKAGAACAATLVGTVKKLMPQSWLH